MQKKFSNKMRIEKKHINRFAVTLLFFLSPCCCLFPSSDKAVSIAVFILFSFFLVLNYKQIRTDTVAVLLSIAAVILSAISVLITKGAPGSTLIIWNFVLGLLVLRHLDMGIFNKIILFAVSLFIYIYFAVLSFTVYKSFLSGTAVFNPNNVAVYIAVSYIIMATILKDGGRIIKIIVFCAACFAILCSLNCNCRSALLMIVAHLAVYYAPKPIYSFLRRHYKTLLCIAAIIGIAIPVAYVAIWRQNPSFTDTIGGGNGREMIWSTIFEELSSEPSRLFFGVGTLFESSLGGKGAHSWYIGTLYIFGPLVLLAVIALFFRLAASFRQKYAMAGFLSFILLGMTESAYLGITMQLFVFAFILCCQTCRIQTSSKTDDSRDLVQATDNESCQKERKAIHKLLQYLQKPSKIIIGLDNHNIISLSDKRKISLEYKLAFGKYPNLENPKTFNEKLQWLKLHDRNPEYTKMVDKYEAKKYVAGIIGEEYIIPTLGIYDKFDDIDFDKLPNQFVIKCTHDSGGLVICRDKEKLNLHTARQKINRALKRDFYRTHREWPYKGIKPRIIIEKYMEDKHYKDIRDYKFFCFNGKPRYMYISEGLEDHSTARICFFDMDYRVANVQRKDYRQFKILPEKPQNFEKMKKLSRILSKNIPHVRVDWYEIDGKMYFGELTFFTCSGMVPFINNKMDLLLGSTLELPRVEKTADEERAEI